MYNNAIYHPSAFGSYYGMNKCHAGHYKRYQVDYKAAVTELLGKATVIYSRKYDDLTRKG